jgi:hypothetical protein
MRQRRTFEEARGSEGYEIITRCGLQAFPELTAKQRARVADQEREREREAAQFEVVAGEKARTLTRKAL